MNNSDYEEMKNLKSKNILGLGENYHFDKETSPIMNNAEYEKMKRTLKSVRRSYIDDSLNPASSPASKI